jgi:PAS domain S-box-containing protein
MPDHSSHILVVDDDEVKRYTIARTLKLAGYEIVEAETGGEAIARAAEHPALIVLDVKLPDIDGYEVARRLKADPATALIPVLHLSGTFVTADSRVLGLESGADAYLTDVTEPPVLIATIRALLRMRRAEAALRESEDFHRTLVEQIKDYAIFRTDLWGIATTWNEGVRRVLGYEEAEFVGLDIRRLFTPEDVAAGVPEQELRSAAETGTGADDRWMVRRDGTRFWASGTMNGLRDVAGQLVAYTKIMRDLTEQKRAQDALKQADRAKDEFLALLAHELRNPLAPIRTALEIQRLPGADPAAVARAREMMARQLLHMVRLIDDLLDVGRITKGQIDLRLERVELGAVLDTAVETSRPLIEDGRHKLTQTRPPRPVFLEADAIRLAQVVSNLLNNAAKYTPEGGRIELNAELAPDRRAAVIRVRDNGAGISAEMLPRVWGLFTQVDRTLGRAQGGLGIGLTLVKRLVELHGGTVEARSEGLGRGSEFVVRLPVGLDPEAVAPPGRAAPTGPKATIPRRILIVDDNKDGAESLAVLLGIHGHVVRTALDGPSALAAADEFRPEVVLLDIGLPGLDGYAVARELRSRPELHILRLVALTGWGQETDRERSRAAGFDLHLVKPIDPAELLRIVGSINSTD